MTHLKHNVIFIEGLPGSGKTTYAKRLAKYYQSLGVEVVQYNEGDLHPIDLSWCAYCDKTQYQYMLQKYPLLEEEIKKHTMIEDGHYIIAYTKIQHESLNKQYYDDMETYEVYQYSSRERFLDVHQKRWSTFNQIFDPNKLYIFECVLIQNHINELILNDDASEETIIQYFKDLSTRIKDTHPIIFYIEQMDIKRTLQKIIDERRTNDPSKYRDWIDNVTRYMKNTNHGEALGYLNKDGFYRYEKYRQEMAKKLLEHMDIQYQIYPLYDDYDLVFESMKKTNIR